MTVGTAGHPDPGTLTAFFFGELGRDEARVCAEHLWECSSCGEILGELESARDLLGKVPAALVLEDPAMTGGAHPRPEPEQPPSTAARRTPRWAAAAAMIVLVGAGTVTAVELTGGSPSPPVARPSAAGLVITGLDTTTRISASMTLRPDGSSCDFALTLTGVAPDTALTIVADRVRGTATTVGRWTSPADASAATFQLRGTVPVPADGLAAFHILSAGGNVLVTLSMPH